MPHHAIPSAPQGDDDSKHKIPAPPSGMAINKHTQLAKRVIKGGASVAGAGIQVAQIATSTSSLTVVAAAVAGGFAATGVGLVVAGGVLTIASSISSGRAAYKTKQHLNGLGEIMAKRADYIFKCASADASDSQNARQISHDVISKSVLPYIISKKTAKLYRKGASAIPGVGLLETIRAVGKKGYKYASGSLGVQRERAAAHLARHLHECNCSLVEDIIAELYSVEEMQWLKYHTTHAVAVEFLMTKLKST
ncbi:hypothetical protein ACO0LO_22640 [Undibacterium sp. TJN25]|uniref:hypothetical protein n=1 Tax=Undibacterium sp. TJN25 TaxID=3413056 RepID=UPI003BEFA36D